MKFFRRDPAEPVPTPEPSPWEQAEARRTLVARRQARFDALCHAIFLKGAHFRRDFGDWVRLRLDDGTYLQLDSYGRNLMRKDGSGDYPAGTAGYYGGFTGRELGYVGSHFGEPATVRVSDEELDSLEAAVARAPDQVHEGDPKVYTPRVTS